MPSQNDNKISCHPGGFPLCRENVTKCHIFERWRRVNGSEPSPGSEQIEHTKTECPYAKLCEREGNMRNSVSVKEIQDNLFQDLTSLVIPHPTGQILNTLNHRKAAKMSASE